MPYCISRWKFSCYDDFYDVFKKKPNKKNPKYFKMSPSMELSIEVLKLYYKRNSLKTVIKMMQKKSYQEILHIRQSRRLVKRFGNIGFTENGKKKKNTWRLNIAMTFGFIAKLKRVVEETPHRSARKWLINLSTMSRKRCL